MGKAINFVCEFNAFMRFAKNEGLSMRERALWVALFHIANDRAEWNPQTQTYQWPDEFINVSHDEIYLHSGLDKRSIEGLRNQLKQRGLIDFRPGLKNSKKPSYKLIYLSDIFGYENVPKNVPNNVPNIVPNNVPNSVPNIVPNNVPTNDPIYININSNSEEDNRNTQNNYPVSIRGQAQPVPPADDGAWRTSVRVRAAVAQRILDTYPMEQNSSDIHDVLCEVMRYGMTPNEICCIAKDCCNTSYFRSKVLARALVRGYTQEQFDSMEAR